MWPIFKKRNEVKNPPLGRFADINRRGRPGIIALKKERLAEAAQFEKLLFLFVKKPDVIVPTEIRAWCDYILRYHRNDEFIRKQTDQLKSLLTQLETANAVGKKNNKVDVLIDKIKKKVIKIIIYRLWH